MGASGWVIQYFQGSPFYALLTLLRPGLYLATAFKARALGQSSQDDTGPWQTLTALLSTQLLLSCSCRSVDGIIICAGWKLSLSRPPVKADKCLYEDVP